LSKDFRSVRTGKRELIPDPIFSKLASVRQSEIGSGISVRRDWSSHNGPSGRSTLVKLQASSNKLDNEYEI